MIHFSIPRWTRPWLTVLIAILSLPYLICGGTVRVGGDDDYIDIAGGGDA